MRRAFLLLILTQLTLFNHGQIIADHSVVDLYDDIPDNWIDAVKTMLVSFPGESHSVAYKTGMELLETLDPTYACNVSEKEPYTDTCQPGCQEIMRPFT